MPRSEWNYESLLAIAGALGAMLSAVVMWLTGKGTDWWIRISEWRLKRKERLAKLRDTENWSVKEQLLEDKNLAAGYRALFLSYDERFRWYEEQLITNTKSHEAQMTHVQTALSHCLEGHAKTDAQLKLVSDRCSRLEQINERYRNKLLRNGVDPNPSPIHLDENDQRPKS